MIGSRRSAAQASQATDVVDGVAVPARRYSAPVPAPPRYKLVLGLLALGLGVGCVVIGVWDLLVRDASVYRCPPDCGRPPAAAPVATLPRYQAPSGEFSVSYPAPGGDYEVTTGDNGVTARSATGGALRLFSEPAQGRAARQVVAQLMAREYPGSEIAYQLPNTTVGYQVGYGVVANFQQPGLASKVDSRLVVMAAVKNDLALIAVAEGPFRRFSPDFGPGLPSAANLEIAIDMGKYVESFSWKGDPPR